MKRHWIYLFLTLSFLNCSDTTVSQKPLELSHKLVAECAKGYLLYSNRDFGWQMCIPSGGNWITKTPINGADKDSMQINIYDKRAFVKENATSFSGTDIYLSNFRPGYDWPKDCEDNFICYLRAPTFSIGIGWYRDTIMAHLYSDHLMVLAETANDYHANDLTRKDTNKDIIYIIDSISNDFGIPFLYSIIVNSDSIDGKEIIKVGVDATFYDKNLILGCAASWHIQELPSSIQELESDSIYIHFHEMLNSIQLID